MKKFIRKYFWYVPAIIWMLVIFNLSGQVGQASGRLSLQVTEKIVDVIEVVRGGDEEDAYRLTVKLHPYVRKLAHMTEYGILYTLLMLSFLASMVTTRSMSFSILMSFLYACMDEFHQTFVSSRAGQFTDVCIDMTGVLTAVTVTLFIYSFWQERNRAES